MSIMQALFGAAAVVVTPGTQTFTSSGTFTTPAYNTLVVTIEGNNGTAGNGLTSPSGDFVSGGAGGTGGRCVKTYTSGAGPSMGLGITIAVDTIVADTAGPGSRFTFGANPTAYDGANGQDAYVVLGGEDTPDGYVPGADGANGTATGGDTDTTGGSTGGVAKVTITWS